MENVPNNLPILHSIKLDESLSYDVTLHEKVYEIGIYGARFTGTKNIHGNVHLRNVTPKRYKETKWTPRLQSLFKTIEIEKIWERPFSLSICLGDILIASPNRTLDELIGDINDKLIVKYEHILKMKDARALFSKAYDHYTGQLKKVVL